MKDEKGRLIFGAGIDNSQLTKDAQHSMKILKGIGGTAETEGKKMEGFSNSIGKGLIAIGGITALTALGKQILDTTAKFEKFGIVLKNTLGDVEGAAALDMIAKFAATTPFQLDEVTAAFIKMANQGFTPTWDELTKLGDVASSTGKSFDQLTEAILDAQTGQFERLKEFGIKASSNNGKVTFSFKEQQTTVENTNSAIRGYILSLGELEGVQGANAKISASLTGKISNLEDQLAAMYNTIGTANSGILYAGVEGVATLIANYEMIGKVLVGLVATYGTYRAALIVATATSKGYTIAELLQYKALVMVEFAQNLLNKTMLKNPYVLAATLIMAVVSALLIYVNATDKAVDSQGRLDEVSKESQKTTSFEIGKLERLKEILKDSSKSYDVRAAALKDIQAIVPDYHASLTEEGKLINNNSDALDTYVKKLELTARQQVLSTKLAEADLARSQYIESLGKDAGKYLSTKNALAFDQSGTLTVERAAYENGLTSVAFHSINGKIKELNQVSDLYEKELKATTEEMLAVKGDVVTPPATENETAAQKRIKEEKAIAKMQSDVDKVALDLSNKAQQAKIDSLAEGDLKELEQMKLDHKVKMDEIAKQQSELLTKKQEISDKEYLAKGGKGANPTKASLTAEQAGIFTMMTDSEKSIFKTKQDAHFVQMLNDYSTFTQKRNKIILDGEKTIQAFKDKNVGGIYDGNIAEVNSMTTHSLEQLDNDYANKSKEYSAFVEQIGRLKLKELNSLLNDSMELLGSGVLSDEAATIYRKQIEALQDKIKDLTGKDQKKAENINPNRAIMDIADVVYAIGNVGNSFEMLGGTLGDVGAMITGVASGFDNLANVFKYGATSTDKAISALNGVANIIGMIGNQIEANKQAQADWNAKIAESSHLLALARIEEQSYKEKNIYSSTENPYDKAIASAKEYQAAIGELALSSSALGNGQVQTGTKQVVSGKNVGIGAVAGASIGSIIPGVGTLIGAVVGGAVGAVVGAVTTKTVATFTSLKEKYGEIYDTSTYELNPQIIADYDKLDDTTKKMVDNWNEIKKKSEEARASVEETFKNLAGDVGTTLSDALVDAFRNGDLFNAVDDFHAYMTKVIEDIISQMIFATAIQPYLDKLSKGMNDSFGLPTDGVAADPSKKDNSIADNLALFENDYQKGLDLYNQLMDQASTSLSGYDLFGNKASSVSGSSSGFATASQDSIDELNGRTTAIQMSVVNIEGSLGMLIETSSRIDANQNISAIKLTDMRDIALDSYFQLSDINKNTKQLFEMNDKLTKIEKNTQNI